MNQPLRNANAFLAMLPDGDLAVFLADCSIPERMACAATAAAIDWAEKPVPVIRFLAAVLNDDCSIRETEIVALSGFLHELDAVLALLGHIHLIIFDEAGTARWAHTFPYIARTALTGTSPCAAAINLPSLPEQMHTKAFDEVLARSGNALRTGNGRYVVHYSPIRMAGASRPPAASSPTLDMAALCQPLTLRTTMLDAFLTTWLAKLQTRDAGPAIKAAIADAIQTGRRKARAWSLFVPRAGRTA